VQGLTSPPTSPTRSAGSCSSGAVATYQDVSGKAAKMFKALGQGANATASGLNGAASWAAKDAILAGYKRRRDEWAFQSNLAAG
jgi:hypothetical protein